MAEKEQSYTDPVPTTMQDFVFGGIEADPNRLLETEQSRWRGVRHFHQTLPLDPEPAEPVRLTVIVGQDAYADRVTAYVTVDGSDPAGQNGIAENGFAIEFQRVDVQWQPLIWDYVEIWQGEIPGQPEGTLVHYYIEGTHQGQVSFWASEPNLDRTPEQATLYGYHVDRRQSPAWAQEAIVYQIFIDRFAKGAMGAPVKDGWLDPAEMDEFIGGDLPGITARLDYIAALGVDTIWLTPIFTADAYHAYDTLDYYEIDPRFGSKEDLRTLVTEAHRRGLRVILDFVANHTSSQAAIFQEALAEPDSPYRQWFSFHARYKQGYRCFFDDATMPQFNTDSRAVRQFLCDAARYWLQEFDVDGYRLDYAAGPSHSFWSEFSAACKGVKPDCWLFGEVTGMGDLLRSYAGRLDGCLDFGFTRAVRQLCAGPVPTIPLVRFVSHLERAQRFFPERFTLPAFLDNHDMNRFLWVADNDEARLQLGLGLLFAFGGSPILYYGTEVGLSQPRAKAPFLEEARHPMPWSGEQNETLLAYTKALINMRRRHRALNNGEIKTYLLDDDQGLWMATRTRGDDKIWIAVNIDDQTHPIPLPTGAFNDALTHDPIEAELVLPAKSIRFLVGQ